jgi:hypothetical protein
VMAVSVVFELGSGRATPPRAFFVLCPGASMILPD